ncbi:MULTISPECIES: Gfo/Idh/MocA family protein [Thermoactinomyces]|uniref:Gfo/Idh/MocA family oxidoreductase n=1 Tax=Thermoactinomyces daqus TaxID=1329516 RepID=A0A7W1XBN0_9BACL|nr:MULTISPECIES: Gfo/Idh/MocA family oxidoreductase [Thermoactinomyces]MBA4543681.1 Gfo/Idh/MocA family oxidoreductase [Thermoactinomyces daqus]MBH8606197.1 Gfo/Idh/MocA family oxidoreductase [Thermoactinomyces sp. CICC 10521]
MSAQLKIGLIGAGGIAQAHLRAIEKEPRVKAVAIADVAEEFARTTAAKFAIDQVYTDYEKMLEQESLDAVIVCVPNFLHAPVAQAALEAGSHVLCEKPMALNVELAEKMKETADRAGKILMVAQNNRFRAETQLAKKWADDKKFGKIYHAKTGWVRRNGIPGWGSWFTQREKAGGGPLIDVGVHVLDLTLWIMGYPQPVSVLGRTYDMFGSRKEKLMGYGRIVDQGSFNVEDLAVAMIQFADGSSLVLDASWASHIRKESVYLELYGDRGGASLDLMEQTVTLYQDVDGKPVDQVTHLDYQDERLALLKNFVDAVTGKANPICKPEESIMIQRILDAIYQSAQTGELVRFA